LTFTPPTRRPPCTAGAGTPSRPAAPSPAATSSSRSARSAIPSTPASRRSSTAAAGWPASRSATASARPRPTRLKRPTNSWLTDARTVRACTGRASVRVRGRRCDMTQPVQTIDVLLAEHAELEHQLADPELHSKPDAARKAGRRFARLAPIVATHRKLVAARDDLETARELAADDESFADEVTELEERVAELDTQLTDMLAPRDPHDADDIVLEVKSGEGGEESALFAADLARMYIRYAERHGWTVTVLDETTSDLGGYKDATLSIATKGDTADGVWSRMKFEGGVHRVQRVPVTESQGRVHTSAAGVLVYPEPEEVGEVQIDESDLRVDVYRSSGKGGQGVNTTDSAVRITHLPTGIVVTCQNERSQLQNKTRALQVLAARLQSMAEEQALADASADRASQIRTVDRSERIRTYNFPENRIADHRIGYKSHNLDQVLDGDLDALFDALSTADKQSRLQQA